MGQKHRILTLPNLEIFRCHYFR